MSMSRVALFPAANPSIVGVTAPLAIVKGIGAIREQVAGARMGVELAVGGVVELADRATGSNVGTVLYR